MSENKEYFIQVIFKLLQHTKATPLSSFLLSVMIMQEEDITSSEFLDYFAKNIPKGTEAMVDIRSSFKELKKKYTKGGNGK